MIKVTKPHEEIIRGLTLVFVELPKRPVNTYHEKKLRVLWLRFLWELGEKTKQVDPELLEVSEIKEAIKYSEQIAYSPAKLDAYESYWKAVSSENTLDFFRNCNPVPLPVPMGGVRPRHMGNN